jgi:hypothetical protein
MGIHTGEPVLSGEGYVGQDVHRAARICSAAHGGQVLVSEATARLLGSGAQGITLRDLGSHGLKDLKEPEHLYQLVTSSLREDFPALRSFDAKPNNLPRQITPVVGRDQEIKTGSRLLLGEDTALVSLTGPGGTGKTRLALALGQELLDSFPHGVFFVDLSTTTDASLVIPVVASTLSLRELGAKSITETLSDHLAGKQMLLILDNFEQVIEAAPEVSSLLARPEASRSWSRPGSRCRSGASASSRFLHSVFPTPSTATSRPWRPRRRWRCSVSAPARSRHLSN